MKIDDFAQEDASRLNECRANTPRMKKKVRNLNYIHDCRLPDTGREIGRL